jgi:hypothetical protein
MAVAMRQGDASAGIQVFVGGLIAHLAARREFKTTAR